MTLEIWTEKYRPKTLEEVKGQKDIINRLKAFVKSENMPHLLFAGGAGVGKTTSFLALAKGLYGENWRDHTLELNASDERGIDVVRTKIKDFARTKSIKDVPFKLIFLDEADALTNDAQHALRRTMEDYTNTVRFCLSCNYSSKIILPIQSRCAVFRFKPLPKKDIVALLQTIAVEEKIEITDEALDYLHLASEGDCRKAENLLQACSAISDKIDKAAVEEVVSFAEPHEIAEIIKLAIGGNFSQAKLRMADILIKYGLSGMDAIKQIQKQVWHVQDLDDKTKVRLIRACGEYEFRLVEGSNEFIQLNALLADFAVIGSKS